jgi:hypothetical protein
MARDLLGIQQQRILTPKGTLEQLAHAVDANVIFADDFVGSGNQFIETWERDYRLENGITLSFKAVASVRSGVRFYYCPLFSTTHGLEAISRSCPEVQVTPAHVLSERYSALHPNSLIWPDALRPTAVEFLRTASLRGGIPDTGGAHVDDWQGFQCQGLALAFSHSIPDATLGMLRWKGHKWQPLVAQA